MPVASIHPGNIFAIKRQIAVITWQFQDEALGSGVVLCGIIRCVAQRPANAAMPLVYALTVQGTYRQSPFTYSRFA